MANREGNREMTRPFKQLSLLAALAFLSLTLLASVAAAEEPKTAELVGTVTDETGKPLIGAMVHIKSLQEAEIVFPIHNGKTDVDGKYQVSMRFRKSERVVVSRVLAWGLGYVRSEVEKVIPIKGGEKATLDIRLVKGEPLAGILRLQPKALERMSGIKPKQKRRPDPGERLAIAARQGCAVSALAITTTGLVGSPGHLKTRGGVPEARRDELP